MIQDQPLVDQSVIDRLADDVGSETAAMLLGSLKTEVESSAEKLARYFAAGDTHLFENQAHALKSAARSFGAMRLGEACMALELAAKETRLDELEVLLTDFKTIVSDTLAAYDKQR